MIRRENTFRRRYCFDVLMMSVFSDQLLKFGFDICTIKETKYLEFRFSSLCRMIYYKN